MEDLNLYLKDVLTERPHTRVPSADTVLRGYKGFDGYSPGVFTIGGLIVYLENRDGRSAIGTLCLQRMRTCASCRQTLTGVSSR